MNKQETLTRFIDMISDKLDILKEWKDDYELVIDVFGCVVELRSMIYTVVNLTSISEKQIAIYVKKETGLTLDDLQNIEDSFY